MTLRDLLRIETRSPDLGAGYWDQVASDEKFPGISTTGDVSDFPDPDVPALPAENETLHSLLRQIRDKLKDQTPAPVWMTFVQTITAGGTKTFRHATPWRYAYIMNYSTQSLAVFLGNGKGLYLGVVPAIKTAYLEIPETYDSLTLDWGGSVQPSDQVTIIFSSEKMSMTIV